MIASQSAPVYVYSPLIRAATPDNDLTNNYDFLKSLVALKQDYNIRIVVPATPTASATSSKLNHHTIDNARGKKVFLTNFIDHITTDNTKSCDDAGNRLSVCLDWRTKGGPSADALPRNRMVFVCNDFKEAAFLTERGYSAVHLDQKKDQTIQTLKARL